VTAPLGVVKVHTGVHVCTRAVERVAVTAVRTVVGVTSLEPTLASMATELGRAVRDAATGRSGDESGHGVDADIAGNGVALAMWVSVGARNARDVCAEIAVVVRRQVWEQLGVQVMSVRTTVVDIAALPVDALSA